MSKFFLEKAVGVHANASFHHIITISFLYDGLCRLFFI